MIVATDVHASSPQGAPFIIERCSFRPGQRFDYAHVSVPEGKLLNWPMVYILANETAAYVGQTTSAVTRMNQHGAAEEKQDFTSVNFIYNEEFNASVITDYEHRLIGLMHADGKYKPTNKNDGMTDTEYFSKSAYSKMFETLWEQLRRYNLVDHTIQEIEESEVFKYSPYKGLTPDQLQALNTIEERIKMGLDASLPIVVEGMPGTGKTILAIYLLKKLRDDPQYRGMNIRILEPVTSLRKTLQTCLSSVAGLSKDDVIGPLDLVKATYCTGKDAEQPFDILLVDEAHRLKQRVNLGTQFRYFDDTCRKLGLDKQATQIDWILKQTKLPIFFYDPLQTVLPSCVGSNVLRESLGFAVDNPIELSSQMRVKGGKAYLSYILDILSDENPSPMRFQNYDFKLHKDFKDFVASFERTYAEHSLSRMVAGYAWKWISKGDVSGAVKDIVIDGIGLRWNCTYDNWVGRGIENEEIAHEVGCIHSIQGYDLSYAYVIIGNDIRMDPETGELEANRASYFDRNGYATTTQDQLTRYIRNIYYVLLTRGIYGTHVYVVDEKLRDYFAQFILVV